MIYDLNNPYDVERLRTRLNYYAGRGRSVELKAFSPQRSIKHNAYLHLILSHFALEYGETLAYVKQEIFKKIVNPHIFKTTHVNKVNGEFRDDWRSSAALTDAELAEAIDRFKDYSAREAGIYLPDSNKPEEIKQTQINIKNHQKWL